ncbi:helix-turn-helix transcriptional regulator [Utexia brackfieldae]
MLETKSSSIKKGLSQKELGKLAGIDEFVASTRINRYEQGIHEASLDTAGRLAEALDVPLAYLCAEDDKLAEMILKYKNNK